MVKKGCVLYTKMLYFPIKRHNTHSKNLAKLLFISLKNYNYSFGYNYPNLDLKHSNLDSNNLKNKQHE